MLLAFYRYVYIELFSEGMAGYCNPGGVNVDIHVSVRQLG